MQEYFVDFNGKIGFSRSSPRWVTDFHIDTASEYIKNTNKRIYEIFHKTR